MACLAVYVSGFNCDLSNWEPLVNRLRDDSEASDIVWRGWNEYVPFLSCTSARVHAENLRAFIDQEWATADFPYDGLILIGHSFGGLLVRQAYLLAAEGSNRSPWVSSVKRIVLFAGINRGIDLNAKLTLHSYTRPIRKLARLVSRFAGSRAVGDVLRGSPFVANLRINWIRHFRERDDAELPEVVQVRGSEDNIVGTDDSLDLQQFSKAYTINVAGATHTNVHVPEADPVGAELRYKYLRDAILHKLPDATISRLPEQAHRIIVYILHGIRTDQKTWAEDLKAKVLKLNPNAYVVRPFYGRISALRFALPWIRRAQTSWFQDSYSELLAKNPKAEFHFFGHSNGCYILGRALQQLRGMRFDRVALAGCVLPQNYDWDEKFMVGQVKAVWNHCATTDVPVALLCSFLHGLGMRDVGTSGHRGFMWGDDDIIKRDICYYPGGHGSALTQTALEFAARFLLCENPEIDRSKLSLETKVPSFFAWFSRAASLLPLIILLQIVLAATMIISCLFSSYCGILMITISGLMALVLVVFILESL